MVTNKLVDVGGKWTLIFFMVAGRLMVGYSDFTYL